MIVINEKKSLMLNILTIRRWINIKNILYMLIYKYIIFYSYVYTRVLNYYILQIEKM